MVNPKMNPYYRWNWFFVQPIEPKAFHPMAKPSMS